MFASVEKVATLALVYRELYDARRTGPDNLFEDVASCPGEVSLLAMMGSQAISELDWFLVRAMEEPGELQATAGEPAVRPRARSTSWPGSVRTPVEEADA